MSQTDNKIIYLKLQGTLNYHSRKQVYKIALGKESKPAEPAYLQKFMKSQYRDRPGWSVIPIPIPILIVSWIRLR